MGKIVESPDVTFEKKRLRHDKLKAAVQKPEPKIEYCIGGEPQTYASASSWLRKRGSGRLIRPDEAFSLIARDLEGKLEESHPFKELKEKEIWLNTAFEIKEGNAFTMYVDPSGFFYHPTIEKYFKRPNFSYSEKKRFDGFHDLTSNLNLDMPENFKSFFFGKDMKRIMNADIECNFHCVHPEGIHPISLRYSPEKEIRLYCCEFAYAFGVKETT